jgi:hypothetical protein
MTGGFDGVRVYSDAWVSSDGGISWLCACDWAPWTARDCHQSVALTDDSIVLMGGYDRRVRLNDVWVSRDVGSTWTRVLEAAPWAARSWFSSSVVCESDGLDAVAATGHKAPAGIIITGGNCPGRYSSETWTSVD